ncbi:MAG TPA: Mut7-C RNAse domain-containing protein [Candidatus Cloacimonadota bacterium]|nr:Mut7-C RNAse domain-containing protein [Candidatus Cloacimonadota bacterium]HPT72087.1 Mut7-C RNAse domain-containing protein [Candidatus Cloacimonadota bacterium]
MKDADPKVPKRKFLLTIDLNRMARWLRLLGYDAAIIPAIPVSELIRRTISEERVLITRSIRIYKDKRPFPRFLIQSDNHLQQIKELLPSLQIDDQFFFTRCICCNRPLYPIEKDKVAGLIPERAFAKHDEFFVCRHCGRFYWAGTHWDAMKKTITDLLA